MLAKASPMTTMSDIDLRDPRAFEHWARDTVRFSDTDMVGHVNNVAIAAFAETGRLAFDRDVILPLLGGASTILARLEIDYLRETHWPGDVEIGSRVIHVGNSSLRIGQGLFRDGTCFATSIAVMVNLRDGVSHPFGADARERLLLLLASR